MKESQRLFYSDLDDSLHRPFLLANTAIVSSDSHLIIDGNHLDDVSLLDLSGGDDFLGVGIDSSFTGFVSGGSGSDTLSFANQVAENAFFCNTYELLNCASAKPALDPSACNMH